MTGRGRPPLPPSERNRRFTERRKKITQSRIYIGDSITQWKTLKTEHGISKDAHFAEFLLDKLIKQKSSEKCGASSPCGRTTGTISNPGLLGVKSGSNSSTTERDIVPNSSNLSAPDKTKTAPQTKSASTSTVDLLALIAENKRLKRTVENQRLRLENHQKTIETLQFEVYNKNAEITALKVKEDPDQCSATEKDLRSTIDSLQHEIYKKDLEILNRDAEITVLKIKKEPP